MKKIIVGVLAVTSMIFATSCSKKQIRVERTITINASAETVYNEVSCLKKWKPWSPWAKLDSSITADKNYSGPECGVGTSITWDSEVKKVGKGTQTLTEAAPFSSLRFDLDFFDKGKGTGFWNFEEVGGITQVTWAMETEVPSFVTWMVDFEKEVGPMFDDGLAGLKRTIETLPNLKPIVAPADSLNDSAKTVVIIK